jgi:hypothetical protein
VETLRDVDEHPKSRSCLVIFDVSDCGAAQADSRRQSGGRDALAQPFLPKKQHEPPFDGMKLGRIWHTLKIGVAWDNARALKCP